MSSIESPSGKDAFPPHAIEAMRRTRPWLLFLAIITALSAAMGLLAVPYLAWMTTRLAALPLERAAIGHVLLPMIVLALLEGALAFMQFRLAWRLPSLDGSDPAKLPENVEQVCRRQMQLWATLAILSGAGLAAGLYYLVELAASTPLGR